MADLAVLVPSRGRPGNVERLVEACAATCRADTIVHFGFDDDDPAYCENLKAADGCLTSVEPRMGLAAWTNHLAALHPSVPYLASIGDDMVPETDGWDVRLIDACRDMGGGFAYPDDRRRDDIPEAVVADARIVAALGWFALPVLEHWFIDSVWRDLGAGAGHRLRYCPSVVVRHENPAVNPAVPVDATYTDAAKGFAADMAAYQKWRLARNGMRADIDKVRECLT